MQSSWLNYLGVQSAEDDDPSTMWTTIMQKRKQGFPYGKPFAVFCVVAATGVYCLLPKTLQTDYARPFDFLMIPQHEWS